MLFLLFALCVFRTISVREANSFIYESFQVDMDVLANGQIVVKQTREYSFTGTYSTASLFLSKKGIRNILFKSITDKELEKAPTSTLKETDDELQISWEFTANNQKKSFQFEYLLEGAVHKYSDKGHFLYKIIEDTHEEIKKGIVNIKMPSVPEKFEASIFAAEKWKPMTTIGPLATLPLDAIKSNQYILISFDATPSVFTLPESKVPCCPDDSLVLEVAGKSKAAFIIITIVGVLVVVGIVVLIIIRFTRPQEYTQFDNTGSAIRTEQPSKTANWGYDSTNLGINTKGATTLGQTQSNVPK